MLHLHAAAIHWLAAINIVEHRKRGEFSMAARRSLLLKIFCVASCLGFAAILRAEDAKPTVTTVELSQGGPLEIKAPDGWTVKAPKAPLGTTIAAAPKSGDA